MKIALTREREELYARIDQRVDEMLAAGLLAEVELVATHRHHNALQTVGYQEIFGFLDDKQDWPETVRLLKRNTRRYAKRQLTWLRRDPAYQWLHPDTAEEEIMALLTAQVNEEPSKKAD
ncbi:tRNA dimethylallyltransferase [Hymenobacter qilianensis]|uniref:tRNA dimethylallyltransferase n=1 Tax=Hymenobacter qilianensis TaxID=1385715 RepID=UPI00293B978A|nr:tRNA dimethylallyltransferase [Hymenobacter qilianensis]